MKKIGLVLLLALSVFCFSSCIAIYWLGDVTATVTVTNNSNTEVHASLIMHEGHGMYLKPQETQQFTDKTPYINNNSIYCSYTVCDRIIYDNPEEYPYSENKNRYAFFREGFPMKSSEITVNIYDDEEGKLVIDASVKD